MKFLFLVLFLAASGASLLSAQPQVKEAQNQPLQVQDWEHQFANTTGGIRVSKIYTADSGWIAALEPDGAGYKMLTFKTSDGGKHWILTPIPPPPEKGGIVIFDDNNMYSAPLIGNSKAYKTTNGGVQWDTEEINMQSSVQNILQLGQDTFIAHNGTNFTRTVNGGKTWGLNGTLIDFDDMFFSDSKHGCVVGPSKRWIPNPTLPPAAGFMRTTNSGGTWDEFYTGLQTELRCVWMIDSLHIIAGGSIQTLAISKDGGKTWTKTSGPISEGTFHGIHFPTPEIGYAVASGGHILKSLDGGNTWLELNSTVRYGIDTVDPVYLESVFFADSVNGWVTGDVGLILHTSNGGKSWVRQFLPTPAKTSVSPEPFAQKTTITYSLPQSSKAAIRIFDMTGRELEVLESRDIQEAGTHTMEFDGSRYPSGAFYYRLEADGIYGTGKMTKIAQ